jgi:hypothetical protein
MHTKRSLLRIAGRAAAFSFLMAGAVTLMQAQQPSAQSSAPFQLAATTAPLNLATVPDAGFSSSSSSSDALPSDPSNFSFGADNATQPPPRRRYGRPNYADSHTNADGSNKFTFMAGAGLVSPTQDTGKYLTPSYVFQVGGGRNFNKKIGVLIQFDWNNFGFQNSTVANQINLYNSQIIAYDNTAAGEANPIPLLTQVGGNSHVWSFTLDPTYTFYTGEKMGAYAVAGVGFYHKTANFTTPSTQEACSFYGCFDYSANQTIDDYTSNAVGFNGGLGVTYKPSQFAGEKFYLEARYVFVDNSPRVGYNAVTNPNSANFYPPNANQTYYVPVTFGLRF